MQTPRKSKKKIYDDFDDLDEIQQSLINSENQEYDDFPELEDLLTADELLNLKNTSRGVSESVYHPQLDELNRLNPGFIPTEGVDYSARLDKYQSMGEKLVNTSAQMGLNLVAGFIDGWNYDFSDMGDMLAEKEKEYGNLISETSASLREKGIKDFPIYSSGRSFSDPNYWFNFAAQTTYSIGLMAQTLFEQAGLSAFTASTFGAGGSAQALSLARKAKLFGSIGHGMLKGIQEGYINALQTFDDSKQEFLRRGYSLDDAIKHASHAASKAYKREVGPLMLLNSLQLASLAKANPFKTVMPESGFSGGIETLFDPLLKGVKNKYAKVGLEYAITGISEGFEEGIQQGISAYSKEEELKKEKLLFSDFKLFDDKGEMVDNILAGFLSGMFLKGGGDFLGKRQKGLYKELNEKGLEAYLGNVVNNLKNNAADLKKAMAKGDKMEIDNIRRRMQKDQVYSALGLDYINQKETAFDTYVSNLKELKEAVANKDIETLKKYGITKPEDFSFIAEHYDTYINDAIDIKEKFIKNFKKTQDFDIAQKLTDYQKVFEDASEYTERNKVIINDLLNNNKIYNQLSPDGKKALELYHEKIALLSKARKKISKEQKERLDNIESELSELDNNLTVNDKKLFNTAYDTEVTEKHLDNIIYEDVKNNALNGIEYWSKKENINKHLTKKAKKAVENKKSKTEIEKAKKNVEDKLTPEDTEIIDNEIRKDEIKNENKTKPKDDVEKPPLTEKEKNLAAADEIPDDFYTDNDDVIDTSFFDDVQPEQDSKPIDLKGKNITEIKDESLFEPLPIEKFNEESKTVMKNGVKKLVDQLKRRNKKKKINFDNLLETVLKHKEDSVVEERFELMKEAWKELYNDDTDFDAVYSKYFTSIGEIVEDMFNSTLPINEETKPIQETNKEIKNELISKPIGIDLNNLPIVKSVNLHKTSDGNLKAAYLSMKYERTLVENEDGTYTVDEKDASDEILNSKHLDSKRILDPTELLPGTELTLQIHKDYKDIYVTIWEDDVTKKESLPFGKWVEKYNIKEGSEAWWKKVPIAAHDSAGNPLFFVHDEDWYNPLNIVQDDPIKLSKIIKEGRDNVNKVRENLRAGKSNLIKITEKGHGVPQFSTKDKPLQTLNEVDESIDIGILQSTNDIIVNGKEIYSEEKHGKLALHNTNTVNNRAGHVFQIVTTANGDKLLLDVQRKSLSENQATTLTRLLAAYIFEDKHSKQVKQLYKNHGIDLTSSKSAHKAFSLFANVKSFSAENVDEYINNKILPSLKNGQPFMLRKGNDFFFGIKGKKFMKRNYLTVSKVMNQNESRPTPQSIQNIYVSALQIFEKEVAPLLKFNVLNKGFNIKNMFEIDKDWNIKSLNKPYFNYVKDHLYTNLRSFNIGTNDNPKKVSFIQPTIKYEMVDNAWKSFEKTGQVNEKVIDDVAEKVSNDKPLNSKEDEVLAKATEKVIEKTNKLEYKENINKTIEIYWGGNNYSKPENSPERILSNLAPRKFTYNGVEYGSVEHAYQTLKSGKFDKEIYEKYQKIGGYGKKISKNNVNKSISLQLMKNLVVESIKQNPNSEAAKVLLQYKNFTHPINGKIDKAFLEGLKLAKKEINENNINETIEEKEQRLIEESFKYLNQNVVEVNEKEINEYIDFLSSKNELTTEDNYIKIIKDKLRNIKGLDINEEYQLVDFLFNTLSLKIDYKYKSKVDKQQVLKEVRKEFFMLLNKDKKVLVELIKNLEEIYKETNNENTLLFINELKEKLKAYDVVFKNYKILENLTLKRLFEYTGVKEVLEKDDNIDREKNYSKTSLEENGKTTASYRLKRFMAGIHQIDKNGRIKKGFLGMPLFHNFNDVWDDVRNILASPIEIDSDYDLMIQKLEENVDAFPWLREFIDKLQTASNQIKAEFTVINTFHNLSSKFVMYSKNKDGSYTLKVYNTNSHETTLFIRNRWAENLKQSDLISIVNGEHAVSVEKAKTLLNEFNSWFKNVKNAEGKVIQTVDVTNSKLQNWLLEFGISLSNEALNELRQKELTVNTVTGKVKVNWLNQFTKTNTGQGLFGSLAAYLENIQTRQDTTIDENPDNHPYTHISSILKIISRIESKYSRYPVTTNFRDGDKSIYGLTNPKYATDVSKRLKQDEQFRLALDKDVFSKNSIWLQYLNEDEAFREKFSIHHIGLTSLKEMGKKLYGDSSVTSLSQIDYELLTLGLFQDTEQGEVKDLEKHPFGKRIAKFFFPTMSDKSQMLAVNTIAFNFTKNDFDDNEYKPEKNVLKLVYNQTVKPELQRIFDFHRNKNGKTDVKAYDLAAQIFLMFPQLNNIKDDNGKRIIELIKFDKSLTIKDIEKQFGDSILSVIESTLEKEVKEKYKLYNEHFLNEKTGQIDYFDKKYLTKWSGLPNKTKLRLSAWDFVINDFIAKANIHQTIAGDIALYSQGKIARYFTSHSENGKILSNPTNPISVSERRLNQKLKNGEITKEQHKYWKEKYKETFEKEKDEIYLKLVKDIIGTNMGKRFALLLAPGQKLMNSKNDTYKQIFLNDFVDISSNVLTLIEINYGTEEMLKVKSTIGLYNRSNDLKIRNKIAKKLSKQYPEIADYFDIEATDAQEYTTLSEHINVMQRLGKIEDDVYDSILNKIELQQKLEDEGKPLTEESKLSYAELKIVLQPLKPVYTGLKWDEKNKMMRMMYIKSSSIPLLPQITKGLEIDKVRKLLENQEKITGKKVRASYQTANKVGSVNNALVLFNPDGTFNDKISQNEIMASTIELNRDDFKIQQDVPWKSGKKNEDKVSLATQAMKLLFSDGIAQIEDKVFEFNNEQYNGKELLEVYNNSFKDLINLKKQGLFKELSLDEEGNIVDIKKTTNKLQKLLKKEAEERGYPKQDIDALELTSKVNIKINGQTLTTYLDSNAISLLEKYNNEKSDKEKIKKELAENHKIFLDENEKVEFTYEDITFNIPLWLSPNSNRYESLLNAIVTNRLSKIKLPGSSYVVASEAGFKYQNNLEGIEESNIIYTSKFKGELNAAEFDEKGNLRKTQVFLPSKFRDNEGNLIMFINEDGSYNEDYVFRNKEGKLMLKEHKIDEKLLSLTSIRIPTSSHVSLVEIEIVGILPTESGDVMVVPRNLTKQKGLDFDIDKETTYQLHTYIDNNGNIKILDEEGKKYLLKKAENISENNPEDKLLKVLLGINSFEDIDITEEDIQGNKHLEKINQKLNEKIQENNIVGIHKSVLSSNNKEVQKKIMKVLSIDFAKSQAELIDATINKNVDNTYFSPLAASYQYHKMQLGAAGKLGIGVYSNYVVFHSLLQQVTDKTIKIEKSIKDKETGKYIKVPFEFTLGNQKSNGTLGNNKTLIDNEKYQRTIAEVFAELQNIATDNEKEQVMGRVNINEYTINVSSLLSLMGFDKDILDDGVTEVSLPFLFLSQPIIRDYVKMMKNSKSKTVEFNKNAKDDIIETLKTKYKVDDEFDSSKELTGQVLFDNLTKPNNNHQLTILKKFLELDKLSSSLSDLQNLLNINSKGLGKSFVETIDKYENVDNFIKDFENNKNGSFSNISSLVGRFKDKSKLTDIEIKSYKDSGYIEFENYLILPETPVGSMLINTVHTGYNMWEKYFPYQDAYVKKVMNDIMTHISDEETSAVKKIKLKHQIFEEMKKYFYSSSKLGTFEGNAQQKRYELFIDDESTKKQSLASFLSEFLLKKNNKVSQELKQNKLLSKFEYSINKNGLPSLIKFNNSIKEEFDEDYLYVALVDLMDKNLPMGEFNGKKYTTRDLGKDLVAYAYLEGGIQKAIQFVKYIPVEYLKSIGLSEVTREWNSNYRKDIFGLMLGVTQNDSRFMYQFLQNNPERLPKLEVSDSLEIKEASNLTFFNNDKKLINLKSFSINEEELNKNSVLNKDFVVIYNKNIKKGMKKYQIYQKDGNTFFRISTLGIFGMSEYSIKNKHVVSLINEYYKAPVKKETKQVEKKEMVRDFYNIEKNSLYQIIENIIDDENFTDEKVKNVAKLILPIIDDVPINITDFEKRFNKPNASGVYRENEHRIYINSKYLNKLSTDRNKVGRTIIHEAIHAITVNYMKQYLDKNGNLKLDKAPNEIKQLQVLYNNARELIGEEKINAVIQKFENKETLIEEDRLIYGVTSIKEFVTLMIVESDFQKKFNVKYKNSNKTFIEKLANILKTIVLKVAGKNINNETITSDAIYTIINLMENASQKEITFVETTKDKIDSKIADAENTLNSLNSLGIISRKDALESLKEVESEFFADEIEKDDIPDDMFNDEDSAEPMEYFSNFDELFESKCN